MKAKLSRDDVAILRGLGDAREIVPEWKGWLTPIWLGGSDGSQHSKLLDRLHVLGLVQRKRRGGFTRPSYFYRITPAGRRAAKQKAPKALHTRKRR